MFVGGLGVCWWVECLLVGWVFVGGLGVWVFWLRRLVLELYVWWKFKKQTKRRKNFFKIYQ